MGTCHGRNFRCRLKAMKAFFACTTICFPLAPAFAQTETPPAASDAPPPSTLSSGPDIVVTAQRRAQRLQDVGVSVSAITSDALRSQGVANAQDISKVVAGVTLDSVSSGGNGAQLVVRGVSQSDFSSFQESPNSIYIDDIYLSSPAAAAFTLYDLQRVEVLRGPQGTLFGRASSGGLANFITKRPTDTWQGYAEMGYGSYNDAYAEAALGGPLTSGLRFRLSGRREIADGWWHNDLPGGKNSIAQDFVGIRGQLEADISDRFTARLSVSYDRNPRHDDGVYRSVPFYKVNGQPTPLPANVDAYGTGPGNDATGYRDTDRQGSSGAFNNVGYVGNSRFSPTLYLTYKIGQATIESISNYTRFKFEYNEDCDGGPVDYCQNPSTQDLKQYSQELRINGETGRLNYTAGLYYLNTDQQANTRFFAPSLAGQDFAFDDSNFVHQRLESEAVFAQIEYKFTDQLKLTVGGRYTQDTKIFSSQVFYNELGNGYAGGTGSTVYNPPLLDYDFSQATVGDLAKAKSKLWTGKVQLDYKPNQNILIYAGVSRGAKGAGFNANLAGSLTLAGTPFKSEYLYDYEAGAKIQMLDRRVTLNLSAFNYDYHRFQGYAFTGLQGVVGNYDGYFRGGELELSATPVTTVNLHLGVSYLQSKLYDVPTAYDGVRDVQGVNSPRWTVKGSISKDFEIGSDKVGVQWSGDYEGDRYASVDNNAATLIKGSFVHNARISYHFDRLDMDLAAFVNNISNVNREIFAFDLLSSSGNVVASYAKPRWFGASLRKSFGG